MDTVRLSDTTYLVGSGKGGVGKSTVSVNLAVAMAACGLKVGLLDADVYGPSLPVMMGLRQISPTKGKDGRVLPFEKFGVKCLSVGFFVEEAQSMVWRGPVLHTTLQRMIMGVNWGKLDVLLVDLPPGTGDVPLTLSKLLNVDGAVVVTTPQEVAIVDAIKAINSYHQLEIPLLGIVENMAGFTDPKTGEVHHLFGQGKGAELADRFNTELLASIPLFPRMREEADRGIPAALHAGPGTPGELFRGLARQLLSNHYQPAN